MGEPAGSSTAEHQPVPVAAGEAGEALDVVERAGADVHHLVDPPRCDEFSRSARSIGRGRVDHCEHASDVAGVGDRGEDAGDQFPLGGVGVRRAHHDDAVGLPQGAPGPGRHARIGLQDNVVVADIGFVHELGETRHADVVSRRLRDRRPVEHQVDAIAGQVLGGAEAGDLRHHVGHQCVGIALRGDRHGQRRGPVEPARGRAAQAKQNATRHVEHHRRRSGHEFLERDRRERRQRRVADCPDGCRSWCLVEQAQLTHHFAATEFGDQLLFTLGVEVNRHASTDDEVGGIGDVALLEQHLARFQPTPADPVDDLLQGHLVGAPHQFGDHRRDIRAIDALASLVRDSVGHLGVAVQPSFELDALDLQHLDRPVGGERGGTQSAGNHRHLADHMARLDRADEDVTLRRRPRRRHSAGLDEVHLVGGDALLDEHLAVGERDRAGTRRQTLDQLAFQCHPVPFSVVCAHPPEAPGRQ